ncbi:hypothetical protein [Flavobacterium difficile]|uniref:Lipoprotein n=1 Tax=Flavobacterium difficile TaxID=2709659 RepID=A0ABX0I7V1_9FLAO|nr:hypothetical protein [Flavobacterium difficile]NHM01570.1 hypothetical protein [Flavobacterium difficile]
MSKQIYISTIFLIILSISCSTNKGLIEKRKTEFGITKYYIEKDLKNNKYKERLLATIDNSVYYSIYSDKIVKQTKKNKQLIYTLFFDNIPENLNDTKYYQNLTKMDSIVLTESNKILNSLNLQNFKKWNGAKAFIIEVNYYHGYPKNRKFKPY